MNRIKRSLALTLVCVLLLGIPTVFAVGTGMLTGASITAKAGETVEYTVSLDNNPGMAGFRIKLEFDTTALSVVTEAPDSTVPYCALGAFSTKGTVVCATTPNGCQALWYHTANVTGNGSLFTVRFAVAANAAVGEYPVRISYVQGDTVNIEEARIPLTCTNGKITIAAQEKPRISGAMIEADAGGVAEYMVSLANNPGLAGARIQIDFDKAAFSLVMDAEDPTVPYCERGNFSTKGSILCNATATGCQVLFYHTADTTNDGVLFKIRLSVAKDAPGGIHPVTVRYTAADTMNAAEQPIVLQCTDGAVTVRKKVTGITLDHSTLNMEVGGQTALIAHIEPTDASNQALTWASSAVAVATVDKGTVTAVNTGTATITATAADGAYTASCVVTVVEKTVAVTAVTIAPATFAIAVGESTELTATIYPSNATNKNIQWSSSDATIATVQNGTVTGIGEGNVTIRATSEDGGYQASCSGKVSPASQAATKIKIGEVMVRAGNDVIVPVLIEKNPGFAAFLLTFTCDATALQLTDITKGSLLQTESGALTKNTGNGTALWADTVDTAGDGELLMLTFHVKDTAAAGNYKVGAALTDGLSSNFCNHNDAAVRVAFTEGAVVVPAYTLGDLNEDGAVTALDAGKLARYLVGLSTLSQTQLLAADVNCDNSVTALDAGRLARYLVGLLTELKPTAARTLQLAQLSKKPEISFATKELITNATTEFTLDVTIKGNSGFSAFNLAANYDATALTLVAIERGSLLQDGAFTPNEKNGRVFWVDTQQKAGDGILYRMKFRVNSGCTAVGKTFKLDVVDGNSTNFVNGEEPVAPVFKDSTVGAQLICTKQNGLLSVQGVPDASGTMYVAAYEDNGRLLAVQTKMATTGNAIMLSFAAPISERTACVQMFVLDDQAQPKTKMLKSTVTC